VYNFLATNERSSSGCERNCAKLCLRFWFCKRY
jgi:hypothetical protein